MRNFIAWVAGGPEVHDYYRRGCTPTGLSLPSFTGNESDTTSGGGKTAEHISRRRQGMNMTLTADSLIFSEFQSS
ncbi:MAG: hypothetical protein MZV63_71135 [Marinilabiliales bacterium]|nr:hypothetical protein [Marinilabiliales bacterium]